MRPLARLLLGGAVLLLAACAPATELAQQPSTPPSTPPPATQTAPPPVPQPTGVAAEWDSCLHPVGLTVAYPAGWHVNSGEVLPECSAFAPDPLEVPEAQEFFDAGVMLRVEPVALEVAGAPDAYGEVLDRSRASVDGHEAVRVEAEADGQPLLPEGTRSTHWVVALDDRTSLVGVTYGFGDRDYQRNRGVLDAMVARLKIDVSS